ncbi:MAG: trypsin-like peptidase domain-containing protein, partial [Ruminococcus sp.]|nr:trypsin-like peptidase domain-containing protein [Ruminococcus sp.]
FDIASRTDSKYLPDIVDEIMPSVVGVSSTFEFTKQYSSWGWGFQQPESVTQEAVGTGTGIVMTEDGYIITNAHVIYDSSEEYHAGEAKAVSVLFSDKNEYDAKIIAYDVETDIAVLKIDETGFTPATFGNSDDLRVGELVIAVGNPLGFELFGSVTSGIVSALNREISINEKNMTLIQTDAAINSGNSGGPLLNSCGQVIGINSAKMSSSYASGTASIEGLGFAIPINDARIIIDDLINNGYVTGRPQIGITAVDIDEMYSSYLGLPMGIYVRSVAEGSAAEMAGLRTGDVIIGINDEAVTSMDELNAVKNQFKAGDTVTLKVYRDGEDIDIPLVLHDANAEMSVQKN